MNKRWQCEILRVFLDSVKDLNNFASALEEKLEDGWQLHGLAFDYGDYKCQTIVKYTPPTEPKEIQNHAG